MPSVQHPMRQCTLQLEQSEVASLSSQKDALARAKINKCISPDPSNQARTDQNSRHAPKTTRNERLYGIRCAFGSSGRWRLYRLCFVCTLTKAKLINDSNISF